MLYLSRPAAAWATGPSRTDSRLTVGIAILGFAAAVAATNDLSTRIPISGTTLQPVLTTLLALIPWPGILLQGRIARTARLPLILFGLFFAHVLASTSRYPVTIQGIQNATCYAVFFSLMLLAANEAARPGQDVRLWGVFKKCLCLAGMIFMLAFLVAFGTTGQITTGENLIVAPRTYALMGTIAVAVFMAEFRYDRRIAAAYAAFFLATVVLSVSRTATLFALATVPAVLVQPTAIRGTIAMGIAMLATLAGYVLLVTNFGVLNDSFSGGDSAFEIGGFAINSKGRMFHWLRMWESFQLFPWTGNGLGSFQRVMGEYQPHNDHLRLLHDFGLVGFGLWISAIMLVLVRIWRAWRLAHRLQHASVRYHFAALLSLVAFLGTMLTDNVLIYLPNIVLAAILCGLSLGAARQLELADRAPLARRR